MAARPTPPPSHASPRPLPAASAAPTPTQTPDPPGGPSSSRRTPPALRSTRPVPRCPPFLVTGHGSRGARSACGGPPVRPPPPGTLASPPPLRRPVRGRVPRGRDPRAPVVCHVGPDGNAHPPSARAAALPPPGPRRRPRDGPEPPSVPLAGPRLLWRPGDPPSRRLWASRWRPMPEALGVGKGQAQAISRRAAVRPWAWTGPASTPGEPGVMPLHS